MPKKYIRLAAPIFPVVISTNGSWSEFRQSRSGRGNRQDDRAVALFIQVLASFKERGLPDIRSTVLDEHLEDELFMGALKYIGALESLGLPPEWVPPAPGEIPVKTLAETWVDQLRLGYRLTSTERKELWNRIRHYVNVARAYV